MNFSLLPLFVSAFILTSIASNAQQQVSPKAKKIFEKAEELYSHFDYYHAIDYYKQYLDLQKGNQESMLKIADSYYKIKDYDQTLAWYDSCVVTGNLPPAHELQYANVLMNHGMNDKAIVWLKKYITSHPNDKRANEKLNGLENVEQFFKDYRYYTISNFPYNSKASDFSPAYYKNGLVFVSDRGEASGSAASDQQTNTAYLDFYYVDIADTLKKIPSKLKGMNNKFNEGPLTIYDNNKKMIFTRNDLVKKEGINGNSTLHFQMFYTESKDDNAGWSKPTLLSIHDKQYSMGHPTVSEDGKTLYFASNIPGGYGGSDIYKSRWENNIWGKPVNLGSEINSEGDEMFPYIFNDSILYFSSDGLRGLGGLDIFKYNLNHPTEIKNVGYPINSTKDDFGIAYSKNGLSGYFSSNREGGMGGDDIYKFTVQYDLPQEEALAARVFKEQDLSSLPRANVKIISFTKSDVDLIANDEGIIDFYLPKGAAYIIIGSKGDYIGMYANTVMEHEDKDSFIHPVSTSSGHKDQVPVAGRVLNKKGELLLQASVVVTDQLTNEKISAQYNEGLFTFFGHSGKTYTITADEKDYQSATVQTIIPLHTTNVEKISIILNDGTPTSFALATRVFKEMDQSALSGAHVSIISFTQNDMELTANAEGVAEFNLPIGSSFVIIGSKDDYAGMYANVVMQGAYKSNIVYPVSTTNGHENQVAVVGRVVNTKGALLPQASGTVTDQSTHEKIPVQFKDGLFSFFCLKGKVYEITADDKDYQSATAQASIPSSSTGVEKISITLNDKPSSSFMLATRVFKEGDQSPLSGAHVSIISFTQNDLELTANADGVSEFDLPVGSPYVIIGSKDDYAGMYANVVMPGENKSNVVYPVSTTNGHENQVAVVGRVVNTKGELLPQASGAVTDQSTHEKIPVQFKEGLFSFFGLKGQVYEITAADKDYQSATAQANIPSSSTGVEKISITLSDKPSSSFMLATRVFKEVDQSPLRGAHVSIISFTQTDLELTANEEGIAEFDLPVGSPYVIIGSKDDYAGTYANVVLKEENKNNIVYPVATTNGHKNQIAVVGRIMNKKGTLLPQASGTVIDQSTNEKIAAQFKDGLFSFYGSKGMNYLITAEARGYQSTSVRARIHPNAMGVEKISITLSYESVSSYMLATRVFKEDDQSPLSGAHVSIVNFAPNDLDLIADADGVADFNLPVGSSYVIVGKRDDYVGMYASVVMKGENKNNILYPVSASHGHADQVSVVGRILNEKGELMPLANSMVIDPAGLELSVKIKNGIFYFFAQRGKTYRVMATAKSYDMQEKNIHIDSLAPSILKIEFTLLPAATKTEGDVAIIALNDAGTTKFYLTTPDSHHEIIERDSNMLYLENAQETRALGKGSLTEFSKDPIKSLHQYNVSADRVVSIQNIYFDYDKAILDDNDKVELDKIKDILQRYPRLNLYISSYADVRGGDSYNLNLSKKRSEAIRSYLVNQKIDIQHVIINSYGEADPVVSCSDCTEQEHQKNRRAEFSLRPKKVMEAKRIEVNHIQVNRYAEVLEKYGDKKAEGLVFKIAIGAYRYNHGLTFDELKDLGSIEKQLLDGIMYYYVTAFATLKDAEQAKVKAIDSGVGDAYIAIFYKDKKISFPRFISLTD